MRMDASDHSSHNGGRGRLTTIEVSKTDMYPVHKKDGTLKVMGKLQSESK